MHQRTPLQNFHHCPTGLIAVLPPNFYRASTRRCEINDRIAAKPGSPTASQLGAECTLSKTRLEAMLVAPSTGVRSSLDSGHEISDPAQ